MLETAYYIYALKGPMTEKPFYIGKGTGVRAWEHAAKADENSVGTTDQINPNCRIGTDCVKSGRPQALKLESELISVFGTEEREAF